MTTKKLDFQVEQVWFNKFDQLIRVLHVSGDGMKANDGFSYYRDGTCPGHPERDLIEPKTAPITTNLGLTEVATADQVTVGDVNSSAKGSGARYNAGKPPFDLVPLGLMAEYYAAQSNKGVEPYFDPVLALAALGEFQAGGDGEALLDILAHLGDGWEECANVFGYGRSKYSKRGDCTCNASNVIRMKNLTSTLAHTKGKKLEEHYAECASGVTTKISKTGIQDTESGKQPIIGNGWKTQKTGFEPGLANKKDPSKENSILFTKSPINTKELRTSTDYPAINTTHLWPKVAEFAEASRSSTSTTAIPTDTYDQLSAIPATLALDLSKGLGVGLAAHSHTCGVHQTPGQTGSWNWSKGMAWSVPIACAARHLLAMIGGETLDPESGLPHRGHVYCNVAMLYTFIETYEEGDDRAPAGSLMLELDDADDVFHFDQSK